MRMKFWIGVSMQGSPNESFGVDLKGAEYALDTTAIDLCLFVFPWAPFRRAKAAVKLHTLLELRGKIPVLVNIKEGKMHDVNILCQSMPDPESLLHRGSRIPGLRTVVSSARSGQLFCHARKREPDGATPELAPRGLDHGNDLRSDDCAHGFLLAQRVPDVAAARLFQRSEVRRAADLPDQQFQIAGIDDHGPVSMPLAGRAPFQVDQAASSYHPFLQDFRERGKDADRDRSVGVRAGSHRERKLEYLDEPHDMPKIVSLTMLEKTLPITPLPMVCTNQK
jgi:hypothetical protein